MRGFERNIDDLPTHCWMTISFQAGRFGVGTPPLSNGNRTYRLGVTPNRVARNRLTTNAQAPTMTPADRDNRRCSFAKQTSERHLLQLRSILSKYRLSKEPPQTPRPEAPLTVMTGIQKNSSITNRLSRRQFLGATSAATIGAFVPRLPRRDGVQIGAISYSFRQIPSSAEKILGYMVDLGLSTIELMGSPAEVFAGAPTGPGFPSNFRAMSPDERATFRAARAEAESEMGAWRSSAPMDRFKTLGTMYRDAGVDIDILKLGSASWTDEHIDYSFNAARAVGARGISMEISDESAERLGPFATRHEMVVGFHNHTQVADEHFSFDTPLSFSHYNMLNLDIGHYVAGLGTSPVPVLQQYHDRISHLHLKDRRSPDNGGDNLPWGEGDTPIGDVLRLLRDEQYPITAMIELEYPIPEGSDVLAEMAKCVEFCKDALS